MTWFIIIIAIFIGTLMPIQTGVNSHLAQHLNHPLHAAFISFLGGFITIILVCLLTRKYFPSINHFSGIPPHLFIGGMIGVTFVITVIILAPKLGAVVLVSCVITGQLLASLVLDHYGWLGFPVHQINLMRIVGILFLFTGVLLVKAY